MDEQKVIWIASYPKSGNTWMRTLLRNYYRYVTGIEPVETNDMVPYFYHTVSPKSVYDLTPEELAMLRPAALMHSIALHTSASKPSPALILKSHLMRFSYANMPLWSPLWAPKVIYIHRDPRDILPSYTDHLGIDHAEGVELMNTVNAYIGGPPGLSALTSTWSNHTKSWIEGDGSAGEVLRVSYEEMHEDTCGALYKVLKFLGEPISAINVARAVSSSTFDKLHAREGDEGFPERTQHQRRFFRRGIVGSHKDEVDACHITQIESDHEHMMKELGYLD